MINTIQDQVKRDGFVNLPLENKRDLAKQIRELCKKKRAVILGHYYVDSHLQDVADYVGDSLELSRKAQETDAEIIVFVGVHFMAEVAKILNPNKKVLIPDLNAGCSLAEAAPKEKFEAFLAQYPNHKVISYINCTAEVKALSDIICTSSNAQKVIESFPVDQPLIFAPDKNLGNYLNGITGRDMVLYNGTCIVHEQFSLERIMKVQMEHPDAELIAHPECEQPILIRADYIGSTTALLKYTQSSPKQSFIVATESGILHKMRLSSPDKTFLPAPPIDASCGCSDCAFMKLNTIEKLYLTLKHELPELNLDRKLAEKAKAPLLKMLSL